MLLSSGRNEEDGVERLVLVISRSSMSDVAFEALVFAIIFVCNGFNVGC